ncbi:cache domain-containing sensor histidine kinase [Fictibacillus phosphorivorans]|uniref:cache domain-containing sensor histidine kinase n=1 Tax=Fictibacillus phosphorivorans TaxID=1221500 RepID=UPI00203FB2D8|nr:histidine kinase [Fictibacillus phosphorivorans]MCM3718084.1 histidine kinase [Fictibacillus phosphorivorans]MCM3775711.1 histidine kinase [Fictibacillus phosphorivorans]
MEQRMKVSSLYRKELKRSLIGFGIVPVAIIVFIFYNLFFVISYQILEENTYNEGKKVADELQLKFSQISNQSVKLASEMDMDRLEFNSSYRQEMYGKLYNAVNEQKLNSLFLVIDSEGNVLATNWTEEPDDNHKNAVWYLNKRLKKGDEAKSLMYPNRQTLKNDRVFYNIANPIYDKHGQVTGYIIFNLLENKFRQQMNNVHYTDIVITDQYENSILTSNEMLLTQAGKLRAVDGNRYILNKISMMDETIQVHSILYISLFKKLYKIGLFTLIGVFLLITIGTIAFANQSTRKKMRSIDQLLEVITNAKQGHFNQEVKFDKEDEFQVIGVYVQQLLHDIDCLIKENNESVKRSSQAELKQLEMQIDPHFLFNTLENIKYITKINPAKAERLIVILSKLLRYSISNNMQFNRIEADINYLRDYLTLQKTRFGDALDYTIDVQPGTEEYPLPKLIIQPLVENSIKYGFQTKANLKIEILIRSTKKALYLIIRDHGEGIEKERLKALKDSLLVEENDTNHIGIYNVNRRIRLLYGKRYGLRIFSEKGVGTLVVVRLPIIKEGSSDDNGIDSGG